MSGITLEQMYDCAKLTIDAEDKHSSIPQLVLTYPDLTFEEAYEIQNIRAQLRVAQGRTAIGYKMGLTSKAKQAMIGRNEPTYGVLFDYMPLAADEPLDLKKQIQPKVETEIAFVMKSDLGGAAVTAEDVLQATDYVTAALEIIDSRYHNFKFSSQDGIADNISASRIKLGKVKIYPYDIDLANIGVTITINGQEVASGKSSAVLDHPANAVAMLVQMLHKEGTYLKAGQIVMTGAITAAFKLEANDKVTAEFDPLETLTLAVI